MTVVRFPFFYYYIFICLHIYWPYVLWPFVHINIYSHICYPKRKPYQTEGKRVKKNRGQCISHAIVKCCGKSKWRTHWWNQIVKKQQQQQQHQRRRRQNKIKNVLKFVCERASFLCGGNATNFLQLSSYHLNLLCFWLKMRLRKIYFSVDFITLNFSTLLGPTNEK